MDNLDNLDNLAFIKVLEKYRLANFFNAKSMGVLLEISPSEYERIEAGEYIPDLVESLRIMRILVSDLSPFDNPAPLNIPMSMASYLKYRLLYGSISTQAALTFFSILAKELECQALLEWVELEKSGSWSDIYQAPMYRFLQPGYDIECEQDGASNFMSLPPEFVASIGEPGAFFYDNPINDEDEAWAKIGKIIPVPEIRQESLQLELQTVYGSDFKLIRVAGTISRQFLQKILLAVQEVMLRFLIWLETQLGEDASLDDLIAHKHMAALQFSEILDIVGSADHLDLPIKLQPQQEVVLAADDVDAFCDWLDEQLPHLVLIFIIVIGRIMIEVNNH